MLTVDTTLSESILIRYGGFVYGIPSEAQMLLLQPASEASEQPPMVRIARNIWDLTTLVEQNAFLTLHLHLNFLQRLVSAAVAPVMEQALRPLRITQRALPTRAGSRPCVAAGAPFAVARAAAPATGALGRTPSQIRETRALPGIFVYRMEQVSSLIGTARLLSDIQRTEYWKNAEKSHAPLQSAKHLFLTIPQGPGSVNREPARNQPFPFSFAFITPAQRELCISFNQEMIGPEFPVRQNKAVMTARQYLSPGSVPSAGSLQMERQKLGATAEGQPDLQSPRTQVERLELLAAQERPVDAEVARLPKTQLSLSQAVFQKAPAAAVTGQKGFQAQPVISTSFTTRILQAHSLAGIAQAPATLETLAPTPQQAIATGVQEPLSKAAASPPAQVLNYKVPAGQMTAAASTEALPGLNQMPPAQPVVKIALRAKEPVEPQPAAGQPLPVRPAQEPAQRIQRLISSPALMPDQSLRTPPATTRGPAAVGQAAFAPFAAASMIPMAFSPRQPADAPASFPMRAPKAQVRAFAAQNHQAAGMPPAQRISPPQGFDPAARLLRAEAQAPRPAAAQEESLDIPTVRTSRVETRSEVQTAVNRAVNAPQGTVPLPPGQDLSKAVEEAVTHMDLKKLSERVYRDLESRLRAEKARRGKW